MSFDLKAYVQKKKEESFSLSDYVAQKKQQALDNVKPEDPTLGQIGKGIGRELNMVDDQIVKNYHKEGDFGIFLYRVKNI